MTFTSASQRREILVKCAVDSVCHRGKVILAILCNSESGLGQIAQRSYGARLSLAVLGAVQLVSLYQCLGDVLCFFSLEFRIERQRQDLL